MHNDENTVPVWDAFVRIGHWTLAAAFLTAYFSAEEFEDLHVAAGYWVGGYVIARTLWGFIGSPHARFRDFVYGPRTVFGYLADMAKGRPAHYVGHNPAGGAMILALLLCLAATAVTGLALQAQSENEGPLAPWLGHAAAPLVATPAAAPAAGIHAGKPAEQAEAGDGDSALEEIHELFANLTLGLAILHVLGVIAASLLHRENLVRAMITGRKAAVPAVPRAGLASRPER
ncbi:cytochrome b/b6 domain-containing protein [Nevskia soli]|uniref:cytochrome b/b6 domain-containing protein n=1 Tax=Nevskia soli TaxID=418856 RepID=UPI0004A744AE|nr:cytochrome b/b6 domain-containing protein [Nevskia soli]